MRGVTMRPRDILFLVLWACIVACAPVHGVTRLHGPTMGTTWSVQLDGQIAVDDAAIVAAVNEELDVVIAQMSTWQPDSTISRFNASAPGSTQTLPEPFASVLIAALDLAEATDGAFDPTVGSLVALWGFGAGAVGTTLPAEAEIQEARQDVGWQKLPFDRATARLRQPGGMHLDMSSLAEGFAVDRIGAVLERFGITDYLAEIGGELRARGRRPGGAAWQVALESPEASSKEAPVVVALRDRSIATSGDYRKFFIVDGKRYSHTMDPHTGRPVTHALASVTVIAANVMTAGSTATALNVLGPERGRAFAEANDIAARFMHRSDSGFITIESTAFTRERNRQD